jgi:hypothetical protein
LVDGQLGGLLRDLRDQLHGGGTRADHGDALAGEVRRVVPLRGVDDRAGEVGDAVDVGQSRLGQEPGRRHQVRRRAGPRVRRDDPVLLVLLPACSLDAHAELHVPTEAVGVGDVLGVPLQLGPPREPVLPVGVWLERVRVGDARDVDGEARIVVHVPGAAQVVLALEDRDRPEVVTEAEALEADGRAHAAEARADDEHVVVGHAPCLS